MIKSDQIPKEVVAAIQICTGMSDAAARGLAIIMLEQWPSAAVCHYTIADNEGYEMVLPLPFPQESGDV